MAAGHAAVYELFPIHPIRRLGSHVHTHHRGEGGDKHLFHRRGVVGEGPTGQLLPECLPHVRVAAQSPLRRLLVEKPVQPGSQSRCRTRPGDPEDLEPDKLFALLEIDGVMVMVVDTDWNGVNYYGFAPVETDE